MMLLYVFGGQNDVDVCISKLANVNIDNQFNSLPFAMHKTKIYKLFDVDVINYLDFSMCFDDIWTLMLML